MELQTHAKIMSKAIQQRQIDLHEGFMKKKNIDNILLGGTPLTEEQIEILMKIIGKDHIFRSAETIKTRTLRHLLWKVDQGFKHAKKVLSRGFPELKGAQKIGLEHFSSDLLSIIGEREQIILELDNVLHQEENALSIKNIGKYNALLRKEKEVLKELSLKNAKATKLRGSIASVAREFFSQRKQYLDDLREKNDVGEAVPWLKTTVLCTITLTIATFTWIGLDFTTDSVANLNNNSQASMIALISTGIFVIIPYLTLPGFMAKNLSVSLKRTFLAFSSDKSEL